MIILPFLSNYKVENAISRDLSKSVKILQVIKVPDRSGSQKSLSFLPQSFTISSSPCFSFQFQDPGINTSSFWSCKLSFSTPESAQVLNVAYKQLQNSYSAFSFDPYYRHTTSRHCTSERLGGSWWLPIKNPSQMLVAVTASI